MPQLVRTETGSDNVATITLADPDRRNALGLDMVRALTTAVEAAVADGAGAIVLAADPPVFCAGGSLDDLAAPRAPLEDMYDGFRALARCPVPTVAAVGATCVGAGVNLPLACDLIVTSPEARFDPRWLDVGIHPGGGNLWSLAQRVGRQGAAALVLFGESIDGEEAAALGLAWTCVPAPSLMSEAQRLAATAASRDRELVERTKRTLDESLAVRSHGEAIDVELEPQRWSMQRPVFQDMVARAAERLRAKRS